MVEKNDRPMLTEGEYNTLAKANLQSMAGNLSEDEIKAVLHTRLRRCVEAFIEKRASSTAWERLIGTMCALQAFHNHTYDEMLFPPEREDD